MLPHCAGAFPIDCSNVRWIAGADMAPTGQMSVALQCAPAAGISAAGNWQDFGTSRWQLSKSAYTNFRDAGRRRNGQIEVHSSLLNMVLHDKPEIKER
jgi:hypothetical protein